MEFATRRWTYDALCGMNDVGEDQVNKGACRLMKAVRSRRELTVEIVPKGNKKVG